MALLTTPRRLRATVIVTRLGGGSALLLIGAAALASAVMSGVEQLPLLLVTLVAWPGGGHLLLEGRRLHRLAVHGEEVIGELVVEQAWQHSHIAHLQNFEARVYRFRIAAGDDWQELAATAKSPASRPLFLDEQHHSALVVRLPDDPAGGVIVRADFWPFALRPDEERAARERINQVREVLALTPDERKRLQLHKLMTDLHTC